MNDSDAADGDASQSPRARSAHKRASAHTATDPGRPVLSRGRSSLPVNARKRQSAISGSPEKSSARSRASVSEISTPRARASVVQDATTTRSRASVGGSPKSPRKSTTTDMTGKLKLGKGDLSFGKAASDVSRKLSVHSAGGDKLRASVKRTALVGRLSHAHFHQSLLEITTQDNPEKVFRQNMLRRHVYSRAKLDLAAEEQKSENDEGQSTSTGRRVKSIGEVIRAVVKSTRKVLFSEKLIGTFVVGSCEKQLRERIAERTRQALRDHDWDQLAEDLDDIRDEAHALEIKYNGSIDFSNIYEDLDLVCKMLKEQREASSSVEEVYQLLGEKMEKLEDEAVDPEDIWKTLLDGQDIAEEAKRRGGTLWKMAVMLACGRSVKQATVSGGKTATGAGDAEATAMAQKKWDQQFNLDSETAAQMLKELPDEPVDRMKALFAENESDDEKEVVETCTDELNDLGASAEETPKFINCIRTEAYKGQAFFAVDQLVADVEQVSVAFQSIEERLEKRFPEYRPCRTQPLLQSSSGSPVPSTSGSIRKSQTMPSLEPTASDTEENIEGDKSKTEEEAHGLQEERDSDSCFSDVSDSSLKHPERKSVGEMLLERRRSSREKLESFVEAELKKRNSSVVMIEFQPNRLSNAGSSERLGSQETRLSSKGSSRTEFFPRAASKGDAENAPDDFLAFGHSHSSKHFDESQDQGKRLQHQGNFLTQRRSSGLAGLKPQNLASRAHQVKGSPGAAPVSMTSNLLSFTVTSLVTEEKGSNRQNKPNVHRAIAHLAPLTTQMQPEALGGLQHMASSLVDSARGKSPAATKNSGNSPLPNKHGPETTAKLSLPIGIGRQRHSHLTPRQNETDDIIGMLGGKALESGIVADQPIALGRKVGHMTAAGRLASPHVAHEATNPRKSAGDWCHIHTDHVDREKKGVGKIHHSRTFKRSSQVVTHDSEYARDTPAGFELASSGVLSARRPTPASKKLSSGLHQAKLAPFSSQSVRASTRSSQNLQDAEVAGIMASSSSLSRGSHPSEQHKETMQKGSRCSRLLSKGTEAHEDSVSTEQQKEKSNPRSSSRDGTTPTVDRATGGLQSIQNEADVVKAIVGWVISQASAATLKSPETWTQQPLTSHQNSGPGSALGDTAPSPLENPEAHETHDLPESVSVALDASMSMRQDGPMEVDGNTDVLRSSEVHDMPDLLSNVSGGASDEDADRSDSLASCPGSDAGGGFAGRGLQRPTSHSSDYDMHVDADSGSDSNTEEHEDERQWLAHGGLGLAFAELREHIQKFLMLQGETWKEMSDRLMQQGGGDSISVVTLVAALKETGFRCNHGEFFALFQALGVDCCPDKDGLTGPDFCRLGRFEQWIESSRRGPTEAASFFRHHQAHRILMESITHHEQLIADVHLALERRGMVATRFDTACPSLAEALDRCFCAARGLEGQEFAQAAISRHGLRIFVRVVISELEESIVSQKHRALAVTILSTALDRHGGARYSCVQTAQTAASTSASWYSSVKARSDVLQMGLEQLTQKADGGVLLPHQLSAGISLPRLRIPTPPDDFREQPSEMDSLLADEVWQPLLQCMDPEDDTPHPRVSFDGPLFSQVLALLRQARLPLLIVGPVGAHLARPVSAALRKLRFSLHSQLRQTYGSWSYVEGEAALTLEKVLHALDDLATCVSAPAVNQLAAAFGGRHVLRQQLAVLTEEADSIVDPTLVNDAQNVLHQWCEERKKLTKRWTKPTKRFNDLKLTGITNIVQRTAAMHIDDDGEYDETPEHPLLSKVPPLTAPIAPRTATLRPSPRLQLQGQYSFADGQLISWLDAQVERVRLPIGYRCGTRGTSRVVSRGTSRSGTSAFSRNSSRRAPRCDKLPPVH